MFQNYSSKKDDIKRVIVDIQGFTSDTNNFIPKEIAIQCADEVLVLLIKPPYPYNELSTVEKSTVDWIERRKQLFWEGGFIPYEKMANCVQFLKNRHVYIKGCVKVKWLKDLLSDDPDDDDFINYRPRYIATKIYNLEHFGCPNMNSLYKKYKNTNIPRCDYHPANCAFTNVHYLMKWCADAKMLDE